MHVVLRLPSRASIIHLRNIPALQGDIIPTLPGGAYQGNLGIHHHPTTIDGGLAVHPLLDDCFTEPAVRGIYRFRRIYTRPLEVVATNQLDVTN